MRQLPARVVCVSSSPLHAFSKQPVESIRLGKPAFRRGVMAVVTRSGPVRSGDPITVVLPGEPHVALARV